MAALGEAGPPGHFLVWDNCRFCICWLITPGRRLPGWRERRKENSQLKDKQREKEDGGTAPSSISCCSTQLTLTTLKQHKNNQHTVFKLLFFASSLISSCYFTVENSVTRSSSELSGNAVLAFGQRSKVHIGFITKDTGWEHMDCPTTERTC